MTSPMQPGPSGQAPVDVSKATPTVAVGFTYPASDSPHRASLPDFMHMNAARLGVRLLDVPASSPDDQARAIGRFVVEKMRSLLLVAIAPGDEALTAAATKCKAAGIPVVSLGAPEEPGSDVASLYSAELEAQAALASLICTRLGCRGKVLYLHDGDLPADAPQLRGLRTALEAFPAIELVSVSGRDGDSAPSRRGRVADHPDVAAVMAARDDLALSAIEELATLGLAGKPLVAGFGGSPEALLAIEQGTMTATVRLDFDAITTRALGAALRSVDPTTATAKTTTTFTVTTRDNLERVCLDALRKAADLTRDMARRASQTRAELEVLDAVIDTIPLNLFVKTAGDLRLVRVNKAREAWFGISRWDQIGKTARDLYPLDLAERFEASDRAVLNGDPDVDLPEEHPTMSPRGLRYVQTKKLPIYAHDGSPSFLVGVSFDVTERKLAELALAQRNVALEAAQVELRRQQSKLVIAEKMASLGRLTAGIAHEMNTPLAAVRAAMSELSALVSEYADALGDAGITDDDHRQIVVEMRRSIDLAERSATRAGAFVRGMKSQTRDLSPHEHADFNMVATIKESILLLSHALRDANCRATFSCSTFDGDVDNVPVFGSPVRLSQVVTNLVTNAIDASKSKGGGVIELALLSSGNRISLRVTDYGCGIPPEIASKIFEPMFTTKPFGQGTGLGLSILHDIVTSEFNGSVEVHSVVGQGTTFELFLGSEKDKVA